MMPRRMSQRPGRPSGMRARPAMPTRTSRRRARDSDIVSRQQSVIGHQSVVTSGDGRCTKLRTGDCGLTTDDWEYQSRSRLDRDFSSSRTVALEFLGASLRVDREERIELWGDHDPEPMACQKAVRRHQPIHPEAPRLARPPQTAARTSRSVARPLQRGAGSREIPGGTVGRYIEELNPEIAVGHRRTSKQLDDHLANNLEGGRE